MGELGQFQANKMREAAPSSQVRERVRSGSPYVHVLVHTDEEAGRGGDASPSYYSVEPIPTGQLRLPSIVIPLRTGDC